MNSPEWILCERSHSWQAALRKALQRDKSQIVASHRLIEVRNLSEAAAELDARPDRLVFIEVHRANFAEVLSFLAEVTGRLANSRVAVLVDAELTQAHYAATKPQREDRQMFADILLEAGAAAVVDSPRRLGSLFELAQRHTATWASRANDLTVEDSVAERAWASLPWQAM